MQRVYNKVGKNKIINNTFLWIKKKGGFSLFWIKLYYHKKLTQYSFQFLFTFLDMLNLVNLNRMFILFFNENLYLKHFSLKESYFLPFSKFF